VGEQPGPVALMPRFSSDSDTVDLPRIGEVLLQREEAKHCALLHQGERRHGHGITRIHKERWLDTEPLGKCAKNGFAFGFAVDARSNDVHGV
jgi:hypothetical protein